MFGFNITGGVIEIGSGSVMDITYQAASVDNEEVVSLNILEFYLGDSLGYQIPAFSEGGDVTIVPAGASVLSVSDLTLSQGGTGTIEISLTNEIAIAGFQFNVVDTPDLLTYLEVSGTERTEAFNISANELENEVITLGFSFYW